MKRNRAVSIWLWVGVIMIFVQILLGGITRLTGSGLSITKWEIVTGTLPPLNKADWQEEFEKYKVTPQYNKINTGMTLSEFKSIYFWEYIHRVWARLIGFVFLIPFLFFSSRRWLTKEIYSELGIAVFLGVIVATFGWIMVASGLVDRPWVNAYKLTIHLNLAIALYAWLLWIAFGSMDKTIVHVKLKNNLSWLTLLLILQLLIGGLMSGTKAGLYYPTWPDMHGEIFPKVLIDSSLWTWDSIVDYERGLIPGLIQFTHRLTAYLIFILSIIMYWKSIRKVSDYSAQRGIRIFLLLVMLQLCLGILTVINCIGSIPLFLGVAHQATAILLLTSLIFLHRKIHK